MFCQFVAKGNGCKCQRCGRVVRNHSGDGLVAECRQACAHLGAAAGLIKVECATCNGVRQVDQPAHKCAVRGRCLPAYAPPDPAAWNDRPEAALYSLCRGCADFAPPAAAT